MSPHHEEPPQGGVSNGDFAQPFDVAISGGSRVRLWKRELQMLANEIGIDITVRHLPPGTSKWNKIEHRSTPPANQERSSALGARYTWGIFKWH